MRRLLRPKRRPLPVTVETAQAKYRLVYLRRIAGSLRVLNVSVWIIVVLMVVIQFVFNDVAGIMP